MNIEPTQKSSDVQVHMGSNRLGLIGLILSSVGVLGFGCWLLTIPGLILSLIGLRKEPRTAAIAGTVFGGIGVIEFIVLSPMILMVSGLFLPALDRARDMARITQTTNQIQKLQLASDIFFSDYEYYPETFLDFDDLSESDRLDAWGNQMTFNGDGITRTKITSAGPDGIFDTEDDITNDDDRGGGVGGGGSAGGDSSSGNIPRSGGGPIDDDG